MRRLLIFCLALLLFACESSGPKGALDNMAKALDNNDAPAFLANFDMDAYAANQMNDLVASDGALNAINSFGKMLGLGSIDDLISSLVDVKSEIQQRYMRQVASGELVAQCKTDINPNCPWVPKSLRDAAVIDLGQDTAIARVTTPARITSWLALRKVDGKWLIVGQAVLENDARKLAQTPVQKQPPAQVNPPAPRNQAPADTGKPVNI